MPEIGRSNVVDADMALLLGQAFSINLATRGRSIPQAGPLQLQPIGTHGDAVFADLSGL